jgi:Integrase core domain
MSRVITWLDDHSRQALHISGYTRITGPIVLATFRETAAQHGTPASTLTDNGMVYTTRFAGGRGGRTSLEHELRRLSIVQKNSRPNHPTTCGKVERFQQTMKKWLRRQPVQPATLEQLQTLLDTFRVEYNQRRPHRSLPHRATPDTVYNARPKATPSADRSTETHDRVRTDRLDNSGCVTPFLLLVQDLDVRIVNAATGELLRELTIDPTRDYQGTARPPGPTPKITK